MLYIYVYVYIYIYTAGRKMNLCVIRSSNTPTGLIKTATEQLHVCSSTQQTLKQNQC